MSQHYREEHSFQWKMVISTAIYSFALATFFFLPNKQGFYFGKRLWEKKWRSLIKLTPRNIEKEGR